MATFMIGNSERLISKMIGSSSRSPGSSPLAWSTLSRTFCMASSISTSGMYSTVTMEAPSALTELISLMSLRDFSLRSRGMVMRFSTSSEAAPS